MGSISCDAKACNFDPKIDNPLSLSPLGPYVPKLIPPVTIAFYLRGAGPFSTPEGGRILLPRELRSRAGLVEFPTLGERVV